MPSNPGIGQSGGQVYPVARAIQTFLGQMAGGGINVGAAVIKELLQNADDAGASEVEVILDERQHSSDLHEDYSPLLSPALLIRNNAPFKDKRDVLPGNQDDFSAICDVASGHKRFQATAAGRFGIGFNSVYFLTDTPVLFSRREVHVFDLLHRIFPFPANGWRFPLDDFRSAAQSEAGPLKTVLERILPKVALGSELPFGAIAVDISGDYRQALVRLPLRQPHDVKMHADTFECRDVRMKLLDDMSEQAARAILFLKRVNRVAFGILGDKELSYVAFVDATPPPPEFLRFEQAVWDATVRMEQSREPSSCLYQRTITIREAAGSAWGGIAGSDEAKETALPI